MIYTSILLFISACFLCKRSMWRVSCINLCLSLTSLVSLTLNAGC